MRFREIFDETFNWFNLLIIEIRYDVLVVVLVDVLTVRFDGDSLVETKHPKRR